jgi:hypothetical protein
VGITDAHTSAPQPQSSIPTAAPGADFVFRKEGEYWTIVYAGTLSRLRDTKGLQCLAYLLGRPGERVAAGDLLAATAPGEDSTVGRAPSPPVIGAAERARVLVTKHIRTAIRKIAAHSPRLGDHLTVRIKTGSACAYVPGQGELESWTTDRPRQQREDT